MPFRVYKASAGSGKTFMLVAEYLRLCLTSSDPMAFKRVLAITFTNKAAGEMKTRIIDALAGLRNPNDESQKDLRNRLLETTGLASEQIEERSAKILRAMLHNYGLIGISTIDRFTLRIIRGFAQDLGLPAKFEVNMNQEELRLQIVDMILEQVGQDKDLTSALVDLVNARAEDEKSWRLEELLNQAANNVFNEESRIRAERFKDIDWDQFAELRRRLTSFNAEFETELKTIGQRGIELIEQYDIDLGSFANGKTSGNGTFFYRLNELKAFRPNNTVIKNVGNDNWFSGKCPENDKIAIASIKSNLSELIQNAIRIADEKESAYKLYKVILDNLHVIGLLSAMKKCLDVIQDENDTVSISEFNHLINKQVMDHPAPFIYERLGNRYQHFLIDEFQDTSVLQWFNLLPLIDESLAKAGFCMVVGDGKQSIYRWRGGKVEQFNQLPKLFVEEGTITDDLQKALLEQREASINVDFKSDPLNNNFRSYRAIVDTNNRLFEHLSNEAIPENLRVYSDASQNVKKEGREGLVVFGGVQGKKKDEREPEHLEMLGKWVKECVKDGVSLGDMCVLVRKNELAQLVAQHLLNLGIEVVSKEALAIQGSPIVRTVACLAKFLLNPEDKINAAALIRNFDLLFKPENPLSEAFEQSSNNLPKAIRENILERVGLSNAELLQNKSVFQLFEHLTLKVGGTNSDPRITYFLDMMLAYSQDDQADLVGALELWEEKREKAAIKMDVSANAVRIMTIHQSKGLQFPVVFHPFVEYEPSYFRNEIWAEIDDKNVKPVSAIKAKATTSMEGTSLSKSLEQEKSREELDRLNTYYVALTRAEQRLYVSLSLGSLKNGNLADRTKGFLEKEGWNFESETEFRFGKSWEVAEDLEENVHATQFQVKAINTAGSPNLRAGRSISKENWNDLLDSRQRGQLIHNILEQLETEHDLGMLEIDSRLGSLQETDKEEILSSVKAVVGHPSLIKWFAEDVEVMNEQELLLADGTILRPDRITRKGNELAVIEYKTGNKRPEHEDQVRSYLKALADVESDTPMGFLVYTENLEVEEVSI